MKQQNIPFIQLVILNYSITLLYQLYRNGSQRSERTVTGLSQSSGVGVRIGVECSSESGNE